jgi:uncharacterized protein (DUF1501 family)
VDRYYYPILFSFSKQKTSLLVINVVLFNGGNDGLNTLYPIRSLYYEMRPKIALSKEEVIAGNNEIFIPH